MGKNKYPMMMKKRETLLLLIFFLLLLAGCSSEGEIKIINRTEHNLYFTIENTDYVLEGSEDNDTSLRIPVKTDISFPLFGNNETEIDLFLEGETFMMQYAFNGVPTGEFYTETELNIKSDHTLNIFCDPTHAGVKLVNNSQINIIEFNYVTSSHEDDTSLVTMLSEPLLPNETFWSRLIASSAQDSIIYSFIIIYENGIYDSSYSNIDWLEIDEQLFIDD